MKSTRAKMITKDLMRHHGLLDWKFKWDSALVRFGYASWKNKVISLSRPLVTLNDEGQVIDTILHEIAHALTPNAHHNNLWKATAQAIGCNGSRCYGNEVVAPRRAYIGTCPACSRTITRHRRKKIACGRCCAGNGYSPRFKFQWEVA